MYNEQSELRVGYYDSLKGILILLVIFGHTLEANLDDHIHLAIYNSIYTFHMPLFIFITGYFTKKYVNVDKRKHVLFKLIETLFVFQILHVLFEYSRGHTYSLTSILLRPQWTLWYLYSTVVWKALVFITPSSWLKSWKLILGICFFLSICVGFVPCSLLSISRTIAFLPFFMLGYYAHTFGYNVRRIRINPMICIVAIASLFFLHYNLDIPLFRLLSGKHPYTIMNLPFPYILRACHYFLAILISCTVISLININNMIIKIGEDSLFYYMLHPFIVILTRSICIKIGIDFCSITLILLFCINIIIVYQLAKIPYSHKILNPITILKL